VGSVTGSESSPGRLAEWCSFLHSVGFDWSSAWIWSPDRARGTLLRQRRHGPAVFRADGSAMGAPPLEMGDLVRHCDLVLLIYSDAKSTNLPALKDSVQLTEIMLK